MGVNAEAELIPPLELRRGIGPFDDPERFLRSGAETLDLARRLAGLAPDHAVLDVGCGCGRVALPLRSFLSPQGSYLGFDLNPAPVQWCEAEIAARDSRFRFLHFDLISGSYNPGGSALPADFELRAERQFDVAILSSVITHMFPAETENYLTNLGAVLKLGGAALISALLMNAEAVEAVRAGTTIFDFVHPVERVCWTFDADRPLDGIACDPAWLFGCCERAGLQLETLELGNWREIRSYEIEHDWFVVRRR